MIKLLIVDDESVTRKGLMKYINWNELGVHLVKEARDGIEGLEIANSFHPDIVISDIRMPGMNGIEFVTQIRVLFPESRIIFLSGYSDKEYLKAAIHLNAVSYVEKPINLDELKEVVKKAVTLCLEEEKKKLAEKNMNSAFSESLPFIRQNIIFKLIGRKTIPEDLTKDLQLVVVPFKIDDPFTVLIIKPAFSVEFTNEEKESSSNEILNMLEVCLCDTVHICAEKEYNYIIVISDCDTFRSNKKLSIMFETLRTRIREHSLTCISLFCAVGSPVVGMVRIRESYETAVLALQKLFFRGYNNIVFYENEPMEFISFDQDITTSFLELIQEQKKDKAIAFIEKLCRDIRVNEGTLIDEIKSIFFRMSFTLFKEAEKRGLQLSKTVDPEERYLWDLISNFQTLQEIKAYLISKIIFVFEGIKDLESNSRSIFNVMNYIRKNYFTANLSVKILAEHVYLTPTYLSALFKKETGKTIGEYIIDVRIEKSKELLMDPRIKLFEVARKIGYSDANYYAKVFKKHTGLTPSAFREKYIS
ncbi:MAG TPA: response regulator [Ruminiclostridium sp.]